MQHDSDYMDIPPHYVSLENYRATLAHKINHSFTPNCGWDTIEHPVFGKIPSVVALTDVQRGSIYEYFDFLLLCPTILTDGDVLALVQR